MRKCIFGHAEEFLRERPDGGVVCDACREDFAVRRRQRGSAMKRTRNLPESTHRAGGASNHDSTSRSTA